jgi:oxygen-dependent protoporphyrinogen oxidase
VSPRRVVIVGGGITGLAAAYRLLRIGKDASGTPLAVTVQEARPRVGGNLHTERRDGFVIDGGPDAFVAMRPQALALCKELGLGERLIPTSAE